MTNMTNQELREFIASIAKLQEETARRMAETDRKMAETDRKMEEVARQIAETDKQIKETDKQIKQTDKQLGRLGNKFGSFAEGMALPSMEKILRDRFNMDVVTPRATSRLNGTTIEIDVMAYDNGSRNELYIVEVKSHLTSEGIDQILKTIEEFPKFFGAHRDRTVYGIIAAVDIPQNLRAEVLKQGLYLARIHDGEFELLTSKNFKPRAFAFPQPQNGKHKAISTARGHERRKKSRAK
ncbi:MAG: DUF3782 domain-containing protein [Blastocatellia bacterium]|nr:DUF3782 domain-containing protein [Blastocatellia bacterium]